MRRILAGLTVAAGLAAGAFAADVGTITLFGQKYHIDRFDYFNDITFPDPVQPGFTLGMIESEAVHWLGNNRFLISSDEMDFFGSDKNFVVEAQINYSAALPTSLSYVRTVVRQNQLPPPSGWDLDPAGLTINPTASGIGAGGNLVVADAEGGDGTTEQLRGFDLVSGAQFEFPPGSGCLLIDAGKFCGASIEPFNDNVEDVVFVPGRDQFYTIEDNVYQTDIYTLAGAYVGSWAFGQAIGIANAGEGKGVTYLPDSPAFPPLLRRAEGVILIGYDDQGPGLHAFTLDGTPIALEFLTDNGTGGGVSLLDMGTCLNQLQIESLCADPQTGRILLVMQGDGLTCNFAFLLTPVCQGDLNGDRQTNEADLGVLLAAWQSSPAGDLDGDGQTSEPDLGILLANWLCSRAP